jgi:hypothetical protein
MVSQITYDMQKFGEAVSALAVGTGTIQERLRDALIPLMVLRSGGGLHNKALSAELDRILLGTTYDNVTRLSDDDAQALARSIVDLQSKNWHDAVWALEDQISGRA